MSHGFLSPTRTEHSRQYTEEDCPRGPSPPFCVAFGPTPPSRGELYQSPRTGSGRPQKPRLNRRSTPTLQTSIVSSSGPLSDGSMRTTQSIINARAPDASANVPFIVAIKLGVLARASGYPWSTFSLYQIRAEICAHQARRTHRHSHNSRR